MAQDAFNSGFCKQNNELTVEEAKVAFFKKKRKKKLVMIWIQLNIEMNLNW